MKLIKDRRAISVTGWAGYSDDQKELFFQRLAFDFCKEAVDMNHAEQKNEEYILFDEPVMEFSIEGYFLTKKEVEAGRKAVRELLQKHNDRSVDILAKIFSV